MFSCRLKKLKIQHHSDNLVRVQHLTFILNSSSLIRANYHLKSVLCKGNTVNFIQWFALGQCLSFPPFPAPAGRFYPRSFERGPCWEYLQCVIHRAGGVFWQGPAFPKYQSHMGILVLGAKYWPSDPLASCPSTQPHHLLSRCLPHTVVLAFTLAELQNDAWGNVGLGWSQVFTWMQEESLFFRMCLCCQ